jgi:hypothetical protein
MQHERMTRQARLAAGALGTSLLLVLAAPHLLSGIPITLGGVLVRVAFLGGVPLAAHFGRPRPDKTPNNTVDGDTRSTVLGRVLSGWFAALWVWPWPALVVGAVGGLAALIYALAESTAAAWVTLAAIYTLLIDLDGMLSNGGALRRTAMRALLALAAGVGAAAIAQVETRFADEEFFVAVEALALALIWLLLLGAALLLRRVAPAPALPGARAGRAWLIGLALLAIGGGGAVFAAYQNSFFPADAPSFPGISADSPFLCARLPNAAAQPTYDGRQVFQQLLERVKANPRKGAPEYAMLALGERQCCWAQLFREQLLVEAGQGLFTGPANSVKSVQHNSAQRVYYYARVRVAYPDLFTADEDRRLRVWFGAINRRALTVEWVDWLYALALGKWPEGPYENQESGAGLLAMLEAEKLAAPDLSDANRDYLSRNRRGWLARFRNTDDTFVYQSEWLRNAYFQSLYTNQQPNDHMRRSFEWMLLQALPDGAPLRYNHPVAASPAGVGYLGARLLDDPESIWLTGRALAYLEAHDRPLSAQEGQEQPLDGVGRAPDRGACLLYGDSGTPMRVGPLAPDKIVFRSGWTPDSTYLLLNLRFSGWHRYKATNTVTLLYRNGPLIADQIEGEAPAWLPEGRSLFRDKRIPREQLNGLVVERSGMSAVLSQLAGAGGPWAQDPPYYARVESFSPGERFDTSTIAIDDWHGWRQRRSVYFHHDGPVAIVDQVAGPAGRSAALLWQVPAGAVISGQRVVLRDGEHPAEMLVLPIGPGSVELQAQPAPISIGAVDGKLAVATVFLTEGWVGAQVELAQDAGGYLLRIVQGQQRIELPVAL